MNPGKVNIIIPVFNQEQYIQQCLSSALAQTYRHFDVTLINDGSTDHTMQIVNEMIDRWNVEVRPKIANPTDGKWIFEGKLNIISRENRGLSESRNEGIRAGDGEFILPLDSDDWIEPNYLEKTIPKMMEDTHIGIVSTDMQYEGLLHNRIPPMGLSLAHEMQSNDLPVCSLIRRTAWEQTPGYETIFVEVAGSTKILGYEDWCMWLSILKRGWKVGVINEPLFHYRVKPVSMITQATTKHKGLVRMVHLLHPDLWPNG